MVPSEGTKEWTASELGRRTNLHTGTVHRILMELKNYGLVAQDENSKKFRLGTWLMELGFIVKENLSIIQLAEPIMKNLTQKTKETTHLTIQDKCDGVLIHKIDTHLPFRLVEPIGLRTDLTQGALKKVILAYLPPAEIALIIQECLKSSGGKSKSLDKEKVLCELEDIRKQFYAISYGEVTVGTAAVASPVFDYTGKVVASIGINGPEIRFTEKEELTNQIAAVLEAGKTLTKEIGGNKGLARFSTEVR